MSTHGRSSKRHILIAASIIVLITLAACGIAQPDQSKANNFKIGLLSGGTQFDNIIVGFKAGMTDLGYVEGKNVTYVYDGPSKSIDQLDPFAQKLLAAKVDLIVGFGTTAVQAAKKSTSGSTTPVVFVPVADPVQAGIVQSLKNPGGNITGIATGVEVHAQRLEWLLKIAPNIKRVYVPYDPNDPAGVLIIKAIQDAAPKLGIEIVPQTLSTPDEVAAAITNIPENVDAIFIVPSSIIGTRLSDFVKASIARKLPLASNVESQVNLGSLLTYSFGDAEVAKQLAAMVDKILKGAKPADLPIETSEFFLAINLKTAHAIDLNVPDEILRQAHIIVR